MSTPPSTDVDRLSPECALAQQVGYGSLHADCRQDDIPLPGATGVLLQARCLCTCHSVNHRPKVRKP